MTKIVGTLGPKSRAVEIISSCLQVGMSCDLHFLLFNLGFRTTSGDIEFHQETLENLKMAIKSLKKLRVVFFVFMLSDTSNYDSHMKGYETNRFSLTSLLEEGRKWDIWWKSSCGTCLDKGSYRQSEKGTMKDLETKIH
uniref:Pyruvate kinase n=1 Tax=Lactuca sativa TaxID=4236 RepID=A0A9R1VU24_LACSA|nr:hypothetical protein LSAT_V11C400174350 [Lactuca sativa]